ncbi:MAG: hypothetical protein JSR45_03435 [Proteobacteria bacterium]|nr:hypothetical protein [Pseudomonadota bacterium]
MSVRLITVLAALSVIAAAAPAAAAPAPERPTPPADPYGLSPEAFDKAMTAYFNYGPPQPMPATVTDRAQGQAADAAYFEAFPDWDQAYSPAAHAEAKRLAARFKAEAANLTHEQFVLRVAEIAALADNGHTAIGGAAFAKNTPRVPLRAYWFADGLYVLRAAAGQSDLIGARIDAIDGRPVEQVYQALRRYTGGADNFRRWRTTPLFESPAMLQAAGVAHETHALTLKGVLADGRPFERRVEAEDRGPSAPISNTSRLLFPATPDDPTHMTSLLKAGPELPASLQDSKHLFAMAPLDHGGLYIALGFNRDADEGPIAPFLSSVLERVAREKPAYVVLDMRMNGGGDYTTTYWFAQALPQVSGKARLYLMTGAGTFSAAITTSAALKQYGEGRVTVVGEPVGDRLAFWAEGNRYALPNTGIGIGYTTGKHDYHSPCTDLNICYWLNWRFPVRVADLNPDLPAPMTFAAYRQGHDAGLDAIAAREAEVAAKAAVKP